MKALNIGVTSDSLHEKYTLVEKSTRVIVSRDEAMIKSEK
jgi:hypothetical protein